jgi:hypothetical protein
MAERTLRPVGKPVDRLNDMNVPASRQLPDRLPVEMVFDPSDGAARRQTKVAFSQQISVRLKQVGLQGIAHPVHHRSIDEQCAYGR